MKNLYWEIVDLIDDYKMHRYLMGLINRKGNIFTWVIGIWQAR